MNSKLKLISAVLLSTFVAAAAASVFFGLRGFQEGGRSLNAMPDPLPVSMPEIVAHRDGESLRILAIPAGSVSVKSCHAAGCMPEFLPYPFRFLSIGFDPKAGTTLPIWVYAIVHPEGVWLIDAGPSPTYYDESAWAPDPVSGTLMRGFLRINISKKQLISSQLASAGIGREHVRGIVLTHQHVDHTGQVSDFSGADVWTTKAEDDAVLWYLRHRNLG